MNVVERLGEPDAIIPRRLMMTSVRWKCSKCLLVLDFDIPVKPPAPCQCGGIAFSKELRPLS